MLVDSGVILDHKVIYWDVRPSANFPTVAVRVADVPATFDDTVLLTTLIRAAVMTALDSVGRGDDGNRLLPLAALRAAYWKAAHDGLAGQLLDSVHDYAAVPARRQLDALVHRVRPALEQLGEYDRVTAGLKQLLADDNGAVRQRRYGNSAATCARSSRPRRPPPAADYTANRRYRPTAPTATIVKRNAFGDNRRPYRAPTHPPTSELAAMTPATCQLIRSNATNV